MTSTNATKSLEAVHTLNATDPTSSRERRHPTSRHHGKMAARWQADENALTTGLTYVVYLDSLGFLVCEDGRMQRTDIHEVYRTA